jgi:hypothetical protein
MSRLAGRNLGLPALSKPSITCSFVAAHDNGAASDLTSPADHTKKAAFFAHERSIARLDGGVCESRGLRTVLGEAGGANLRPATQYRIGGLRGTSASKKSSKPPEFQTVHLHPNEGDLARTQAVTQQRASTRRGESDPPQSIRTKHGSCLRRIRRRLCAR